MLWVLKRTVSMIFLSSSSILITSCSCFKLAGLTSKHIKAAYSVTMNIFLKIFLFLFKSFVKVELSYVFTIKMFSTAENCMEK